MTLLALPLCPWGVAWGVGVLLERRGTADAGIERLRDGHHELSERFNQVQARFYSVGGDIARVEQSIQHGQQRQRQLQDDLREAERTRQETESHLGHDRTLLATLAEEMGVLQERITSTRGHSITSMQAVYVPADDYTDPAPANVFAHLDATTNLTRDLSLIHI